ncbi:DUF3626 domain-containing protein [Jiangella aurantiaca]|uniref:DUF3626 domain-containing protein n=1 Tax=Jiangella aurantiaca TaxID=2530373 RepID=A0A4R5AEE8_9ACTN|nr:DUF3626 domain-containing protein [Jiangella aurantiaca]
MTVHFQPDLPVGGADVITALARDGVYRSQFETGVSNGGLTAFRGGDRWRWESRLFGRFYDDRRAADRPKYGSLNHLSDAYGGSPRFGSAHLRLAAHVAERTTFAVPDSVFDPSHFGTADRFALLEMLERYPFDDVLDRYVEAHVHGPIDLRRDVEAIVLDPSYRGTGVERAAGELGCAVEWHPGYGVALEVLARFGRQVGPTP